MRYRIGIAGGREPRYLSATFLLLAGLVCVCYAALAIQQLRYGIEFDEGFNLTVVRNVATGQGYSTTGIVPWAWQVPFDPNASTGPALLLPASLMWWISDGSLWFVRLLPMALFIIYALLLGIIFGRIAGPWAGLAAAASPLVLSVGRADLSTVSLVPGRLVGEFVGVAFLGLMIYFLDRDRSLIAGLFAGLAIQTKFNFALPVVTVILVWVLVCWLRDVPRLFTRVARMVFGTAIPIVSFEIYRLLSVGAENYIPNLKAHIAWMLSSVDGPTWQEHLVTASRRVADLLSTLSVSGALALLVAFALLLLAMFQPAPDGIRMGQDRPETMQGAPSMSPILMFLGAGLSIVIWWGLVPPEKLPRVGIPAILLLSPIVLAGGVAALQALSAGRSRRSMLMSGLVRWGVGLAAGIALITQSASAVTNDFGARMLSEQTAAAEVIAESGTESLPMDWIWNLAEFQILAGIPAETKPDVAPPTILVYNAIRARVDVSEDDARLLDGECGRILYASQNALVCMKASDM